MTDMRRVETQPFLCAPGLRLEAHERLSALQVEALNARLDRIEALMERLERRLWLTVYGIVGVVLAEILREVASAAA